MGWSWAAACGVQGRGHIARLPAQLVIINPHLRVGTGHRSVSSYVTVYVCTSFRTISQQETQLMLTNPLDVFRAQSRSRNMVPFDMLGRCGFLLVWYINITLSLDPTVFQIFEL